MIKKVLSTLGKMLENPKERQKANKFFSALEQGSDNLRYLYGIFQKPKNLSKASRIVANSALAAAGLHATLEVSQHLVLIKSVSHIGFPKGKEIPEKWGQSISSNTRGQTQVWDRKRCYSPSTRHWQSHPLQTRDGMGKSTLR